MAIRGYRRILAYSDIAVLCPNRRQTERFYECLCRRKIPAYWLVRNAGAKRNYAAAADSVLISTVHSAKGLEFENYFIRGHTGGKRR